jgi:hypothetical protein
VLPRPPGAPGFWLQGRPETAVLDGGPPCTLVGMAYLVRTHYRSVVREAEQGGLASIDQARAVAARQLQDSAVSHLEIFQDDGGRAGSLIETITRE